MQNETDIIQTETKQPREEPIPEPQRTGEKLKKIRGSEKQEVFAKKLGVTQSYLSKIESGKATPDKKTLTQFAQVLNVKMIELLPETKTDTSLSLDQESIAVCLNNDCATLLHNYTAEQLNEKGDKFAAKYYLFYPALNDIGKENKFCEKCGRKLLRECPNCQRPLRLSSTVHKVSQMFCATCGRLLIPKTITMEYDIRNSRWVESQGIGDWHDFSSKSVFLYRVLISYTLRDNFFEDGNDKYCLMHYEYFREMETVLNSDEFKEYILWVRSEFVMGPGADYLDYIGEQVQKLLNTARNMKNNEENSDS